MPAISYSTNALADLDEIWDFVAKQSVLQANKLTLKFREKLQHIAENSLIGHPRPDLAPELRSYPVGRYVIFYRPTLFGIELIRLVHSARDLGDIDFS
jgi:toxin ParE1/3/4